MLASIPAFLVLLVGALVAAVTGGHAEVSIAPNVRDGAYGLSITDTVDQPVQGVGRPVTYRVAVANSGPGTLEEATILDDVPPTVADVRWTCAADGGAACPAGAGAGNRVVVPVTLPVGGGVRLVVEGTVAPAAAGASIAGRASLRARARSPIAELVILRGDPVTTLVPEQGDEEDWPD